MEDIKNLYNYFLSLFPVFLHPFISAGLAGFLIFSIFQVIKRNFIYMIVLVILLPASIPILKSVADSVISLVKYILKI